MEILENDSNSLVIHMLDMGNEMYGDCILCQQGDRSILIDGGHPSDFEGQEGFSSIPNQLLPRQLKT